MKQLILLHLFCFALGLESSAKTNTGENCETEGTCSEPEYCKFSDEKLNSINTQKLTDVIEGEGRIDFSTMKTFIGFGDKESEPFSIGSLDCRIHRSESDLLTKGLNFRGVTHFSVQRNREREEFAARDCQKYLDAIKTLPTIQGLSVGEIQAKKERVSEILGVYNKGELVELIQTKYFDDDVFDDTMIEDTLSYFGISSNTQSEGSSDQPPSESVKGDPGEAKDSLAGINEFFDKLSTLLKIFRNKKINQHSLNSILIPALQQNSGFISGVKAWGRLFTGEPVNDFFPPIKENILEELTTQLNSANGKILEAKARRDALSGTDEYRECRTLEKRLETIVFLLHDKNNSNNKRRLICTPKSGVPPRKLNFGDFRVSSFEKLCSSFGVIEGEMRPNRKRHPRRLKSRPRII